MFTIIGGDGKEYGPVPASEVNGWIANGRANLQTKARKLDDDDDAWKTLGDFSEFSPAAAVPLPSSPSASEAATPSLPTDPRALVADLLARAPKLAIGACLSRGWDLWLNHFGRLMLAYLVVIPVSAAMAFVQVGPLPLATMIFGGVFTAGMYRYTLKLLHGEPAAVTDLFAGFSEAPGALMLAGIAIAFFIMTFAMLLSAGFLFCIVPILYFGIAWTFTYPLILEKKLAFVPAMEVSRRVITRNWWRMLILMVAAALLSLIGITALFIGLILTLPISLCVLACAYDSLFNPKNSL
ncbi:MAG TPA: hypothetical protein VNW30_11625 [Opitutaceae bacterium]|jgi:uncharacterized membrane protein|nr:hypothetical protein [Opitutaceae bacterium]